MSAKNVRKTPIRFRVKQSEADKKWYATIRSANNRVTWQTEGYNEHRKAMAQVDGLIMAIWRGEFEIEDVTTEG